MERPPRPSAPKLPVVTRPVAPSASKIQASHQDPVLAELARLNANLSISNKTAQAQQTEFATFISQFSDLLARMEAAESKIEASTGVDAELRTKITETRGLAEQALKASTEGRDEARGQVPVLAKVEGQTKSVTPMTKAIAIINLLVGLAWAIHEINKAFP